MNIQNCFYEKDLMLQITNIEANSTDGNKQFSLVINEVVNAPKTYDVGGPLVTMSYDNDVSVSTTDSRYFGYEGTLEITAVDTLIHGTFYFDGA